MAASYDASNHAACMGHAVVYEIAGIVNNVPVVIDGRGEIADGRLSVEQNADRAPLLWDPALVPFCGLDVLLAISAGAAALPEAGLPEPVRSWTMLFDENGREMGRAVCSGSLGLEDGALRLRAQFLEATFRMELSERIARIVAPYPIGVLHVGDARAVLTSAWSFETDRGNGYWGSTTTCRDACARSSAPRAFSVHAVAIERTDRLRVEIRTA